MAKKKIPKAPKEIPYNARALLRHSYDQAVTHAARLASFAASPLLPGMEVLEDRQNELAMGDLISFGLHLRRLVEVPNTGPLVRNNAVEAIRDGKKGMIPVTTIVNKIIHHQRLEILRRQSDYMSAPDRTAESLKAWMEARRVGYYPLFAVEADTGGLIGLRVAEFVAAAYSGIVKPIVDYCEDCEFYLEDLDAD